MGRHVAVLALAFALSCANASRDVSVSLNPAPPLGVVTFFGMCDASGAVPLAGNRFAVADDEDNVIRVYDARAGGAPLYATDVSAFLALPEDGKKAPEADFEAATGLGPRALWLSSHGRNSSGKVATGRFRLLATTMPPDGQSLLPFGQPYAELLRDLLQDPQFASIDLKSAAERAPKEPDGLNIEGMTARPDGQSILIGFRNPVPGGRALVVPLLNPLPLMTGERARFGTHSLLNLNGLGIRSLSRWKGQYLIVAGGIADEATSRLFIWDEVTAPVPVSSADFRGFNPEAFVADEANGAILLLSDDGTVLIEGRPCKKTKDPKGKRFRGLWISL